MKKKKLDREKLECDFAATKVIGTGKNAHVVPDVARRLRALDRYLKAQYGPPPQVFIDADGNPYIEHAWTGPFGPLPDTVREATQDSH